MKKILGSGRGHKFMPTFSYIVQLEATWNASDLVLSNQNDTKVTILELFVLPDVQRKILQHS